MFCTSAYFCKQVIAMQFHMEQRHSWHLLITVVIIWAIYQAELYQENAERTLRKRLENTILLHTFQRTEHNKGANTERVQRRGYRSRLAQTCGVHLVVGSDRGRVTLPPQTKCSRVHLGPGRDHLLSRVSVRLFCSAPECDYCVHTCPDESHRGGK